MGIETALLIGGTLAATAASNAGSKGSSQSSTPVDLTPPEFTALRQPVANTLQGLFSGSAGGGGAFPGVSDPSRFVAPAGGMENQVLQQLSGLLQGGGATGTAQQLLQSVLSGQGLSPESNPFLQATIQSAQRPLIEQFQDITLPRLQSDFTAAGQRIQPQGSSAFDRSAALATRGLTNALADISTSLSGQNFQQERDRQTAAITQSSQLQTADIQNTISGLQAVALPRLIEQFGIDRGLEEFNKRIEVVLQALAISQGLTIPTIGNQQQQTGATGGPLEGLGGTFSSIFPQGLATPGGLGPATPPIV